MSVLAIAATNDIIHLLVTNRQTTVSIHGQVAVHYSLLAWV
jgi:hypothetical protein